MFRIDGNATAADTDVRSRKDSNGRDISLRFSVEHVDHSAVLAPHRNENFIVNGIGVQLIGDE
jgi:hypothetical protein